MVGPCSLGGHRATVTLRVIRASKGSTGVGSRETQAAHGSDSTIDGIPAARGFKQTLESRLPEVGDSVAGGRYRIVKQLGSGGFGVVYQARQESMARDVAIKFLSPEVSTDPVAVERFRREAFYSSQLKHPNTIVIHDYGGGPTEGALFYIVMELLEGQPLARAIFAGGGLAIGRTLEIGRQILRSLAEAHQKGLVHRDLKPENIFLVELLGETDFVKVLDFGLSKALKKDNPALTQEGVVFGTPLYMAPEQAYGEDVLPASDLFAFGLLLYEMVCGERPFKGRTSMEVLLKLTQKPLPRLPAPLNDTGLQVYIDRLTQKEPQDRYGTAAEALPDLQSLLRGQGFEGVEDPFSLYVGIKAKPKAPPTAPAAPFAPMLTPDPREALPSPASAPEAEAEILPAKDVSFADLFAPEELQRAEERIASGKHPVLGGKTEAPGAISINLELARTPRKSRPLYKDRGIETLITRVEVGAADSPKGGVSAVSFETPTFGRETELQRLDQRGVQALKGYGGLVLVEGDPGVGKTHLVRDFKKMMVRRGAAVFSGAYLKNSIGPGTGLRQAVEQLLGIEGLGDAEAQKEVARRLASLEIDAPEFVQMLSRALRPGLAAGEKASMMGRTSAPVAFRVLERLLVRESRSRPVVIIVEDLHWADPFTLGFTEYLVSSLAQEQGQLDGQDKLVRLGESLPFLCVCTLRKGEVTRRSVLGAIQRMARNLGKGFMRLEVGALGSNAAAKVLNHILPLEKGLLTSALVSSGGNPLFLLELMRYMVDGGMLVLKGGRWHLQKGQMAKGLPPSIDRVLMLRVEQAIAQDPERELLGEALRLSSVLGSRFGAKVLESYFSSLGQKEVASRLSSIMDGLVAAGLCRTSEAEGSYEFTHALFQEVLFEEVSHRADLPAYHEAAARAKERSGMSNATLAMSAHADVANHWDAAGHPERAIEFRIRSARAAEKSLDLETARGLYERVEGDLARDGVSNQMRINVLLCLGALHIRLGALGPAEDILERGAQTAVSLHDLRAEGRARTLMGKVYTLQSRHREALRCFRRAISCLRKLRDTDPADVAALSEAQLGQAEVARLRGELGTAESVLREAIEKAKQANAHEVEAHCLHNLGRIAHMCGRLTEAQTLLAKASERFGSCRQVMSVAAVSTDEGMNQLFLEGRGKAEETVRQSLDVLETAGDQILTALARVHLALILRRGSDIETCTRLASQGLSAFKKVNNTYGIAKSTLLLGELYFIKGDLQRALEMGRSALHLHEKIVDAHGTALSLMFLGYWELKLGDLEKAEDQLTRAMDIFHKGGMLLYKPLCQLHLGRVAIHQGKIDKAQMMVTEAYQDARGGSNREFECMAALMLGTTAMILGHLGKARGFLQTGLSVARKLGLDETYAMLVFKLAWVETLARKDGEVEKFVEKYAAFSRRSSGRDFFFRDEVNVIARSVSIVRGITEADHYRRAALLVRQKLGDS